jgi:adenylate cyclase class IV/ribosomal protein S18 acetylase RimI-like enzyme
MPRNIEIKARIASVAELSTRAAAIADQGPFAIAQDDSFFQCATGRLKLRAFSDERGELIFYRRADQQGPKESFYVRSATSEPAQLRETLALAHGLAGRVRKQRTLFLAGRTRIHLDEVEGLGAFLELEVVLEAHEPAEAGVREAHALMARLGVDPAQLVEGAYVDLLARDRGAGQHADEPIAPAAQAPAGPGPVAAGEAMGITVRQAQAADLESVAELFDLYRQFYEQPADRALARQFIGERLARQESVVLVAQSASAGLVGFCQLYPSFCSVEAQPIYVLYDLFVLPAARQSGVGRWLLQAAEARALQDGKARMDLTTARSNLPAQTLYTSMGWVRDEVFLAYHRRVGRP